MSYFDYSPFKDYDRSNLINAKNNDIAASLMQRTLEAKDQSRCRRHRSDYRRHLKVDVEQSSG